MEAFYQTSEIFVGIVEFLKLFHDVFHIDGAAGFTGLEEFGADGFEAFLAFVVIWEVGDDVIEFFVVFDFIDLLFFSHWCFPLFFSFCSFGLRAFFARSP